MILKKFWWLIKTIKSCGKKKMPKFGFLGGKNYRIRLQSFKIGPLQDFEKKVLFSCMRLRKVLSSDQNWLLRPFPPLTVGIYDL